MLPAKKVDYIYLNSFIHLYSSHRRFDSTVDIGATITTSINTEQGRLAFVRTVSQVMVSKAQIDVNTKKLYMADINAVPEMLKLAKLIYDAWQALKNRISDSGNGENIMLERATTDDHDEDDVDGQPQVFDRNQVMMVLFPVPQLSIQFVAQFTQYNNFKTSQLCSEILAIGTQLYDLLGDEDEARRKRQQVLSKQIAIDQIEATIRQAISQLQREMSGWQERKESLDQDNEDLNTKIEKKFAELNRNRTRLQALYAQRPAFMDELERVEADIVQLYDTYVVHSRCLFFLEQKLEEFEEAEKMKIEVS